MNCECQNWAQTGFSEPHYAKLKSITGLPLIPNHHPNCVRYNDSLIYIYKVTCGGIAAYVEHLEYAKDTAGDEATIERVKMHREVFENLAEFEGF